jgi:hypothetical protein
MRYYDEGIICVLVNVCSLFPFTVCGIDDEGPVSQWATGFQNVNCCARVASEHAAERQNKGVHLKLMLDEFIVKRKFPHFVPHI